MITGRDSISRRAVPALVLAGSLLSAPAAFAAPYTFADIGDTATINFNGLIDGSPVAGLAAQTTFTLASIAGSSFVFSITLANQTDASLWEDARVRSVGFNSDPNVTSVSASGGSWTASLGDNFPGFGTVEICFQATANAGCTGGPGGPGIGMSDSLSLTLTFAALPAQVVLDSFVIRYQSLESDELNVSGGSGIGVPYTPPPPPPPDEPPHKVPEPATLGLLAFALLAMGIAVRRRQPAQVR
jgi:hypothetical protein